MVAAYLQWGNSSRFTERGVKGVFYLTPDQIERLRGYAKERGEDFVTSESMPL